ncbi:MAG: hypothetical protein ACKPDI_05155 [Actinomycetota bacterium]
MPIQVPPVQRVPFHVPSVQRVPVQRVPSHGAPNTFTSPTTGWPFTTRCTGPRAASIEPLPSESGQVCTDAGAVRRKTLSTWMTPEPENLALRGAALSVRLCSRAFTWSGRSSGRASSSSAAAPVTTSAACDEPLPRNRVSLT